MHTPDTCMFCLQEMQVVFKVTMKRLLYAQITDRPKYTQHLWLQKILHAWSVGRRKQLKPRADYIDQEIIGDISDFYLSAFALY